MSADALVIRHSRWKSILLAAASLGFVFAAANGLGFIGDSWESNDLFSARSIALGLGLVFFGAGSVVFSLQAFRAGRYLTIDAAGLLYHRSRVFVAWSDVMSAKLWKPSRKSIWDRFVPIDDRMLVYEVHPDFEIGQPLHRTLLSDWSYGMSGGNHGITASGMDRNLEEIVESFNRFSPERARVEWTDRLGKPIKPVD